MAELVAHGIAVAPPAGWEGRIFRRPAAGETAPTGTPLGAQVVGAAAPMGELSFPVVQVATIPLPLDMADYGSDVVDDLGRRDALVILKEFDPVDLGTPLFEREGMPRALAPDDFRSSMLQRNLEGQGGYQEFFHEAGRVFCLYVVLGDFAQRTAVVPAVNQVLATLTIEPSAPAEPVAP
jgi:hypothetical protein